MLSRTGVLDGNFARADSIIYRMLAHESSRFALVYYTLGRFSLRFEQAPYLNVAAHFSAEYLPQFFPKIPTRRLGRSESTRMWTIARDECSVRHLCNAYFELHHISCHPTSHETGDWKRVRCVLWRLTFSDGRSKSTLSAARTYPPSPAAHS